MFRPATQYSLTRTPRNQALRVSCRLCHERAGVKSWLGSRIGFRMTHGETKKGRCPVPFQRVRINQASGALQECFRSLPWYPRGTVFAQSGSRNCREEHACVNFKRSLAKPIPVDHSRTVAHVDDMTCI